MDVAEQEEIRIRAMNLDISSKRSKARFRDVAQAFGLRFLPLAVLSGAIVFGYYYRELKAQREILKAREIHAVTREVETIAHVFGEVVSDLILLSGAEKFEAPLSGEKSQEACSDLATNLILFCESKPTYSCVCLLDREGGEILKIARTDGRPQVALREQPRTEAIRSDVQRMLHLGQGEVFVSPFELDARETTPHEVPKPVIRFGTPVFDQSNRKIGLLVLHYCGEKLLEALEKASIGTPGRLMLLNPDGYWLKGPDSENEWGFAYPDRSNRRFGNAFPEAWERIKQENTEQFFTSAGFFSFTTIYPLIEAHRNITISGRTFAPIPDRLESKTYYWKIVSHVTTQFLYAEKLRILTKYVSLYFVILLLMVFGVWHISRSAVGSKQAQRTLRTSEAQYHNLYESAPIAYFSLDADGHIRNCNRSGQQMTGYSLEELRHLHISNLFSDESANRTEIFLSKASPTATASNEEVKYILKNGQTLDGLLSLSAIEDEHGGVIEWRAVLIDITQHRQAERALRDREGLLRATFESAAVGILVLSKEREVIQANARFAEMWRIPREFIQAGDTEKILACVQDQLQQPEVFISDVRELCSTSAEDRGSLFLTDDRVFEAASNSLIRDGEIAGRVWSFQDITELHRQQLALQHARAALETADSRRSRFVATMSHKLRTPLNAIIGMTDLALDTNLTLEQREYLNLVKLSTDSLLGVLNDILDFSRFESGKLDLVEADFGLRDFIDVTLKTLNVGAIEKGLKLSCEVDHDVPDPLVGDRSRLRQILVNLIGNAIKFTKEGEVLLRVEMNHDRRRYDPHCDLTKGACLLFSVRDTGAGISSEFQQVIFDAFADPKALRGSDQSHAGFGLAICRQLAELMGGFLWVESEPGRGSTFYFTACFGLGRLPSQKPLEDANEIKRPALEPAPEPSPHIRILLAEDNAINQKLAVRILERHGYDVTVAENGKEVIQAIERAPYDIILMDLQMPEINGLEATRIIREKEMFSGGHIPIVALTAHAMKGDRERCLEAGMDGYLAKPVRTRQLVEAIEAAVGIRTKRELRDAPVTEQLLVLDKASMLEGVEGDTTLLVEIVELFLDDYEGRVSKIREFLASGDAGPLERAAHSLKGAVASFAAQRTAEAARRLEKLAREGDIEGARGAFAELEAEIKRLVPVLKAIVEQGIPETREA